MRFISGYLALIIRHLWDVPAVPAAILEAISGQSPVAKLSQILDALSTFEKVYSRFQQGVSSAVREVLVRIGDANAGDEVLNLEDDGSAELVREAIEALRHARQEMINNE